MTEKMACAPSCLVLAAPLCLWLALQTGNAGATPVRAEVDVQPEPAHIDMHLDAVDIHSAVRLLATLSGQSLSLDANISGPVTLHVQDRPWPEVLDLLVASFGLERETHGGSFRLYLPENPTGATATATPYETITLTHWPVEQALALVEGQPWQTPLNNVTCSSEPDSRAQIASEQNAQHTAGKTRGKTTLARLLSRRGEAHADFTHNQLILRDSPAQLAQIRALLQHFDQPEPQILLEARIVIADTQFSQALGVRLGARQIQGSSVILLPATIGTEALNGTTPPSTLGTTNVGDLLRIELDALATSQQGRVIANPRVVTRNRQAAVITQGEQIPLQNSTTSNGSTSTSTTYKDALLCLRVAPNVRGADRIALDLELHKDSRGTSLRLDNGDTAYPIDTHRLRTQVTLRDGETLVLGGIYQTDASADEQRVPLLGDIPLLGLLFRSERQQQRARELLVFLTPRILKEGDTTSQPRNTPANVTGNTPAKASSQ